LIERLSYHDFTGSMRMLAAALWIGGLMAADPRRVPPVIVDHLGVGSSLQLGDVHRSIATARWDPVKGGLDLQGVCRPDCTSDVDQRTAQSC
jgi:hypothetical protein